MAIENESPIQTETEKPRCQALHRGTGFQCAQSIGHEGMHVAATAPGGSRVAWSSDDGDALVTRDAGEENAWGTRRDLIQLQEEIEDDTPHSDDRLGTSRDLTFKRIALALEGLEDTAREALRRGLR